MNVKGIIPEQAHAGSTSPHRRHKFPSAERNKCYSKSIRAFPQAKGIQNEINDGCRTPESRSSSICFLLAGTFQVMRNKHHRHSTETYYATDSTTQAINRPFPFPFFGFNNLNLKFKTKPTPNIER